MDYKNDHKEPGSKLDATKVCTSKRKTASTARPLLDNRPSTVAQRKQTPGTPEQKQANQQKLNDTGLPDKLKSGIEGLSGYSMDDVKVHYNSNRPAQLKAHAFAQGNEIHLASGQEDHLPHEAWHVVQQKQGRVKPTVQLKGNIEINDDDALEREADVMGSRAMFLTLAKDSSRSLIQSRSAASNSQRKVIQRISTQILMKDDKIIIVIIRGRPPRTFKGSMGDHTTAFAAHVEGLNIALHGKNMTFAVDYLIKLNTELSTLPGYKFMSHENSTKHILTRFNIEQSKLLHYIKNAHSFLNDPVDNNLALNFIQLAINAYLDARELIPFSTINVAARSQGKAGKGHGEAAGVSVLSTYELNPACGISKESLIRAVFKLFDDQSARMLAIETDYFTAFDMTAGVSFGDISDPETKFKSIWEQHRQTIEARFPNVYKAIGAKLSADNLLNNLSIAQRFNLIELLQRTETAIDRLKILYSSYVTAKYRGLSESKLLAISAMYQKMKEIKGDLAHADQLDTALKGEFKGNIAELEIRLKEYSQKIAKTVTKYKPKLHKKSIRSITASAAKVLNVDKESSGSKGESEAISKIQALKDFREGNPLIKFIPREYTKDSVDLGPSKAPSKIESETRLTAIDTSTMSSQMHSMSIQLVLNPDGTIGKMLSSGRPPSPFIGTMGAHTTSWVVHLDRIRAKIVGETIENAAANMMKLRVEVSKMADILVNKRKSNLGRNAQKIYGTTLKQMQLYKNIKPANSNIVELQGMISAILSLYNLLPDVTVNKIDTTGHGEGSFRKQILLYEGYGHGDWAEIKKAMNGLFDGSPSSNMYKYHHKFLAQAYPKAYEFVKTGKTTVAKTPLPKVDDINSDTETDDTQTALNKEQVRELEAKHDDSSWLVNVNNCLINAITEGAGERRATAQQIIDIRKELAVPLGEMLFASQRNLNIILAHLGLAGRGVIVFYEGDDYPDRSSNVSENPIYVQHDGINHFSALFGLEGKPVSELVKRKSSSWFGFSIKKKKSKDKSPKKKKRKTREHKKFEDEEEDQIELSDDLDDRRMSFSQDEEDEGLLDKRDEKKYKKSGSSGSDDFDL